MYYPENLIEAVRYFADPRVCNSYMRRTKWPDGKPACPTGTYEGLELWLRHKYYTFNQGLISLGRIMRDPTLLEKTINAADAWYTR